VRPRLLVVGAFPPPNRKIFGGIVTSCRTLLQSSLPQRADLDLLDSTQICNPPPNLFVRSLLAMRRFLQFIGRFESNRPDAVLLFVAVGASVVEKGAMAWYARIRGVPAMMFPRGGAIIDQCRNSRFARAWMRLCFRGARRILCQSETWQKFFVETMEFAGERTKVIQNWTATPALLRLGAEKVPSEQDTVRLLFVGWIERDKGVFELLEACRRSLGAPFTVDFVGDGTARNALGRRATELGLNEFVRFHGWLSETALEAMYKSADVFVLPSWEEGLPNAMIEAMAARIAVVVSNVGSIPDVITDGSSGLIVRPRDVESLTLALGKVVGNRSLRLNLGTAAALIADERFGVERAVQALMDQVEEICKPWKRSEN